MYPDKFTERLRQQKYIDAVQLEEAMNNPSPVSIRVNPEKWNRIPTNSEQVPWTKYGHFLSKRPSFTFDPLFHSGCYYTQEASSMFLEQFYYQIAGNNESLRVLDLCGAPGGKSTHLSSLIDNRGVLIANEVIRSRAAILAENITKWGYGNTIVTNNDPKAFSDLKNYFDLILVDAPCSGEGMFSDKAVRKEWSVNNAALCSERQKRILIDVWPALKEDGILIYSTCTFNPAENEEIIWWLSDTTDAQSLGIDISTFEGIQEIRYKGITGYGFHPGKIKGEGLFISVIKKSGNTGETKDRKYYKDDNQLTDNDRNMAGKLIDAPHTNLYRNNDIIYNLPLPVEEFRYLNKNLRIIKGGTMLFRTRKDDYTPSHDLALSCRIRNEAFPSAELGYKEAIFFLKKEILTPGKLPRGWILLTYKGVNLGFAKNIGSRINNYFPMEWRIRMDIPGNLSTTMMEWH